MKRNRIAIIAVILLGSLSFWFIINNKKGTIKETLRDFEVADTASITKIFLADKMGRTIMLERKSPAVWTLNGKYTARPDAVQILLNTIKKLDVKQPVGKIAQDNVVKRLAAKSVLCEIYSGDKLIKAYYVGTETQDMTGTYMIMIDPETMKPSAKPFVMYIPGFEGYLTTRYFTEEDAWRDRSVFQYDPSTIRSVKFEAPFNPEFGYEVVVKGNNDYEVKMLADGKPLKDMDTLAVKQYLSYFQQLNFESFEINLSQEQIDSVLSTKPINIITVTDDKGVPNKVKFFARKPRHEGTVDNQGKPIVFDQDRMSAVLDNGKDFVLVQYFVFGKVMPPVEYFLKNKQQTFPEPNKAINKPKA